jgi:hypothetical protein
MDVVASTRRARCRFFKMHKIPHMFEPRANETYF